MIHYMRVCPRLCVFTDKKTEPFRAPKISRECRLSQLFHPPLRQGGDLRLLTAFHCERRLDICMTDPESFYESVGKSIG